jgi:RNA polymerase sigma factor (TIGR02999 family)
MQRNPRFLAKGAENPATGQLPVFGVVRGILGGVADVEQSGEAGGAPPGDGLLLTQVYDQLRLVARVRMADERAGHTLQATELVNEAYLRLHKDLQELQTDRPRFFRAAAEAMRRILIDHARRKARVKRGGGIKRVVTDVADLAACPDSEQIVALDQLIQRLEAEEPQTAEVLKLRYFAGLSVADTAAATGLSERTVKREWCYARAWMIEALQ